MLQFDDPHGFGERFVARTLSPHALRVKKFMNLAAQELPGKPTVPDGKIRELRVRLLLEEVLEFAAASGVRVETAFGEKLTGVDDLHFQTTNEVDLVEAVDGLGDISVVTVGSMLAYGVADVELLKEVDANNLAKFSPGGYKDPTTGKWRKPPDHQPPRIADVLRAQGWCPTTEGGEHEVDAIPVPSDCDELPR